MKSICAVLALALLSGWTTIARADEAKPLDDNFMIKISSCEHAAIQFAKMAERKASSPKVKDFASRMVKDHQKCFDKMAEINKNRKIAVVAGFEKDAKADLDRIEKLSGEEFDREFLKWVINSHKEAVAMFEAQANNGKVDELRTFAKDALPGLRAYLKEAEDLAKTL